MMQFFQTPLPNLYEIILEPFVDDRGLFTRIFCKKEFAAIGFDKEIVQINHSLTRKKGTIRGLHYQLIPAAETKIIRCIKGRVFDVMVDLRADSTTFLQWHSVELSRENMKIVFIPEGFAHGFQTLTDDVELIYHHSEFYNPELEAGLRFDDPALMIPWPLPVNSISPKDLEYKMVKTDYNGL
jgi:dTDP-4-dehydrorhamnose 3,5-epimerase